MKKRKLVTTLLLSSTLAFTGFSNTVNAEDGAKTVYGENLPSNTDVNKDGWADVDFDASSLPQSAQNQISELSKQKDSGKLTQIEYNENVSKIFNQHRSQNTNVQNNHKTQQGERPFGGVRPNGMTQEEYQELENNVPNPNSVSTDKYNQIVKQETENKSSEQVNGQKSNYQTLPETGKVNPIDIFSIASASILLIIGTGLLLFRKKSM